MEIGDAEAETGGGLEAAGGGVHSDGGWGEGVVGWKHESAPVLTIFIRCFGRTGEDVMPSVWKGQLG